MAQGTEGSHSENLAMGEQKIVVEQLDKSRIDDEVAKYASDKAVHIDEKTEKRLKRLIDRRVLTIMIFTYFLQALDKGTLSFASIMGIQEDTGLKGQQVNHEISFFIFKYEPTNIHVQQLMYSLPPAHLVLMVDNLHLPRCAHCRIPNQLGDPASPNCEIPGDQYHFMGQYPCVPRGGEELPGSRCAAHTSRGLRSMLSADFHHAV